MELQHIRLYVMCAKYLSFSRVADLCYTSQPSVSKSISALEAEIGEELFDRSGRKIALTDLGEKLLPYAEALLEREDELKGYLHQRQTGRALSPIVVGISKSLLASPYHSILLPLTKSIEAFTKLHMDSDIKIRECDTSQLSGLIRDGRIDLAVTTVNSKHIESQLNTKDNYLVLKETENYLIHPPLAETYDSLNELMPHLDCLFTVSDPTDLSVTYDLLRETRIPLPVKPCDSWSEVIIYVKNGMGGAILSAEAANVAQKCGLDLFSLKEISISDSLIILWKKASPRMELEDFANTLRSFFCAPEVQESPLDPFLG